MRYLAFVFPLLGAVAFGQNQPLFRSDEAVLAALSQSQSWSGGLSTWMGQLCVALPLGNLAYRLAIPSMIGAGLLGLSCFDLAYALFRAQGGYSRLDPWLAWGASMAAALNLSAASEGTVAGGATLAPALALFLCTRLIERRTPRGLVPTALWGATVGALLCESAPCALLVGLGALMLWPESGHASPRFLGSRPSLIKSVVFLVTTCVSVLFIALVGGWFSHSWSLTEQIPTEWAVMRPWTWVSGIGMLWALGAAISLLFSLRDRRPLYVMCLLALADWLWPSGAELAWTASIHADPARGSLHLFTLGYLAAAGALGLRTFGEAAQAMGLLGARQLAVLVSIVAVAGSLAASEDALLTLSQTDARGAEAWCEEALQALPPRALVITETKTRGRRLRAAQLLGARPDVLVVPLTELTAARNVANWLAAEPELHLMLVDLSLGKPPSERAVARLVDQRPVFVEPSTTWDRRLLEHIEPGLPLSRISPHALARSDRLAALERAPAQIDRVVRRARSGLRSDEATLDVFKDDLSKLEKTLGLVDRVAEKQVAELGELTPETNGTFFLEGRDLEPVLSKR